MHVYGDKMKYQSSANWGTQKKEKMIPRHSHMDRHINIHKL